ncbi:MAG: alpha/beta hydrolase [Deltaproteobacteria bacterium]|nr:alpha/beta hydrolase [Deltaproteobacteria bacterium]
MITPPDRASDLAIAGRRVGWTEWGARDGAPVLFVTGAATSSSLGFGADAIRALGLRLICVDRAGLGRSAPDPAKSFASYARDVAAVIDALALGRPPVVAVSQGAPFAVALAGAGLVSAIAIASGQDELAHPRLRAALIPDVAAMIDAIAADADGFARTFATRVDAEGMWALVMAMSGPEDQAIYGAPEFAGPYRAALREGFAQGPDGYVRDLVLALGRWPTPPEAIEVPVHLWYGLRDTSPVHSPDFGATLATRFPRATRHALADEGGALLWTRSRELLTALVAAV